MLPNHVYHTRIILQIDGDDGRTNLLGRVDDLLDSRHTEGNVHGRHAGKVEGLEGHLSSGLADTLRAQCSNGCAGFHYG